MAIPMSADALAFHHVDVFTDRPYSGNSLAVFPAAEGLTGDAMQRITRELRHFESVFLSRDNAGELRARVFDLVEELDFAGHPLIGAAAVLHQVHAPHRESATWTLALPGRSVRLTTERGGPRHYTSVLDQGAARFGGRPDPRGLAELFGLAPDDLDPDLPPEVVSTGLAYLIVPVRPGALARARVARHLEAPLSRLGASYAYLLDVDALEGRHWSNDGLLEDVATGSGAGCAAAYLRLHGRLPDGVPAVLRQGRFTGRPSRLDITAYGRGHRVHSVRVGGGVAFVAEGRLHEAPR
ncbi:PhzF family phenazine biosynthesis protein [Streptomyces sp. NPDC012769]|uniref:PhzF family phenazine biosynthesis protein n=1 Tax=Streptomyces sp. NPDC012769 TaxID=3364848 RepID=UPI003675D7C2